MRRMPKKAAREARARQKEALVVVTTYIVRTLAVKGKDGYGYDKCVLAKGQEFGCDFISLKETRRLGRTAVFAAGCQVFC